MHIRSAHDLAAVVRGRRVALDLSQDELARRAGVSRKWVSEFETGKATVEVGALLAVLGALSLVVDVTPGPDTPSAPGVDLDELLGDYRRDP